MRIVSQLQNTNNFCQANKIQNTLNEFSKTYFNYLYINYYTTQDLIRTYCIIIFIHHGLLTMLYCAYTTYTESIHDKQQNYAFNQNRRGVGYKYGAFRGSVGMGIL